MSEDFIPPVSASRAGDYPGYIPNPIGRSAGAAIGNFVSGYVQGKMKAKEYNDEMALKRQKFAMEIAVQERLMQSAKTQDALTVAQTRIAETKSRADAAEEEFKDMLRKEIMPIFSSALEEAPGNTPEEKHRYLEDAARQQEQPGFVSGSVGGIDISGGRSPIAAAAREQTARLDRMSERLGRWPQGEIDLGGYKMKTGKPAKTADDMAMDWARKNPKSIPFLLQNPALSAETHDMLQRGWAGYQASEGIDKVDMRDVAIHPEAWPDERVDGMRLNPEVAARIKASRDSSLARRSELDKAKAEVSTLRRIGVLEKDAQSVERAAALQRRLLTSLKKKYQETSDLGPPEGRSWADYGRDTLQPMLDDIKDAEDELARMMADKKAYEDEAAGLKGGAPAPGAPLTIELDRPPTPEEARRLLEQMGP